MATNPVEAPSPAQAFQPAYKRVAQSGDFDCAFACIATIVGRPLDEVRQVAIDRFKLPKHGPYVYMDEDLIAKLFAHWSFTSTTYRETTGTSSIPDLAIVMVDYNPETELGRHVVFVRQRGIAGKPNVEYLIDVGYWCTPSEFVRTELKGLPSWYIGVTPKKAEGK